MAIDVDEGEVVEEDLLELDEAEELEPATGERVLGIHIVLEAVRVELAPTVHEGGRTAEDGEGVLLDLRSPEHPRDADLGELRCRAHPTHEDRSPGGGGHEHSFC
jgi:hypothetical protein